MHSLLELAPSELLQMSFPRLCCRVDGWPELFNFSTGGVGSCLVVRKNIVLSSCCLQVLRGGAGRKTVLLIFQPTHFRDARRCDETAAICLRHMPSD